MKTNWLQQTTIKAKKELHAWQHKQALKEAGLKSSENLALLESDHELAKLPVWQRTSTTKHAQHESPTGAAVLPKSPFHDDVIPRVDGWQKILKAICKGRNPFAKSFLRDVAFQHHQSTNGRWNDALSRWERWGVRSVDEWRTCSLPNVGRATFHRIKDDLKDLGLIEAKSCLWQGKTRLWIKPTDELSRILFEPGYWEQVKDKYVLAPQPKKPRGISARCQKIDVEHAVLFKQAIEIGFYGAPEQQRWEIWDTLTKPLALTKNYTKAPFALKGSSRYKTLHAALFTP